MSDNQRWLGIDQQLADGNHIRSLYVRGSAWQLYTTTEDGQALAVEETLYSRWLDMGWVEAGLCEDIPVGNNTVVHVISARAGSRICSLSYGPYPHQRAQALDFIKALRRSLDRMGVICLNNAIYIERFSLILPTEQTADKNISVNLAAGRFLTGGLEVPLSAVTLVQQYAPYLTESDVNLMLDRLHLSRDEGAAGLLISGTAEKADGKRKTDRVERQKGPFCLPGRPALEQFFREEIIDIVDHEEAYRRMGVGFPGGTVLFGPTGCGKTFAVQKLSEYLGWPVYYIDSGNIGSKYVHETSRKISEIFDQAAENAPAIIIIDEMEAFLSSRENSLGSREIHMEEVAEFLRRIPEAPEKRVLLFGMTNLLETVDKAILRRGRFDHMIEVGMPSEEEILSLLQSLLMDKPVAEDLPLVEISKELHGRPISDISFLIRDVARRTVRAGKEEIGVEELLDAVKALPPQNGAKRRIGFHIG